MNVSASVLENLDLLNLKELDRLLVTLKLNLYLLGKRLCLNYSAVSVGSFNERSYGRSVLNCFLIGLVLVS